MKSHCPHSEELVRAKSLSNSNFDCTYCETVSISNPLKDKDTLDAKLAFIGHDILARSIAEKGTKTIFERAGGRINGRGEIGIFKIRLVSS